MKSNALDFKNQDGAAILIVMMIMVLLTITGIMAARTSNTELQISTTDQVTKIAFYSAEAARSYVVYNSNLYGSQNIDTSSPIDYPNAADATIRQQLDSGSDQSYNGQVKYLNASVPPRGTGFQVGKFTAHNYQMNCIGYGPRDSEIEIEAGFYRIGF
jgi:Tfp pilus assembly protein PilX